MDPKEMISCSREELAAAFREAEAKAIRGWIDDTSLRVRGQTNYYSTVRFQVIATIADPGPPIRTRLQILAVERLAFAYSVGQSPSVAGFVAPTGVNGYANAASLTQTNLSKPKETRNGENMIVTGISAFLCPGSDQALAAWIWQHAHVKLMKNDTNGSPLGPLSFFPALSSINGQGESYNLRPTSAQDTTAIAERFRSSEGLTGYYDMSAAPVVWTSSGKTDSSLFLAVNLDEAYDETVTDRVAAPPLVEAWAPAARFNSAPLSTPGEPARTVITGTYVDILFRFDGTTEAAMSQNQSALGAATMRLRSVMDLVRDLAATPGDAMLRSRTLRTLAEALSVASPDSARYFMPGTSTPCSDIYNIGPLGSISPGGEVENPFQITRPGVAVGLLITGCGRGGLSIEEEAANLEWQLVRENTDYTAANISTNQPGASGFASVAGMSRFVPWLPLLIPARGAGTWTLTVRNIHPGEPIAVVANLAFLRGDDAYRSACAHLSRDPDE